MSPAVAAKAALRALSLWTALLVAAAEDANLRLPPVAAVVADETTRRLAIRTADVEINMVESFLWIERRGLCPSALRSCRL